MIAADAPVVREVLAGEGRLVPLSAQAFAEAIDALPAAPNPAESACSRATASRFGIEAQARRVAGLYEALRAREVQAALP